MSSFCEMGGSVLFATGLWTGNKNRSGWSLFIDEITAKAAESSPAIVFIWDLAQGKHSKSSRLDDSGHMLSRYNVSSS